MTASARDLRGLRSAWLAYRVAVMLGVLVAIAGCASTVGQAGVAGEHPDGRGTPASTASPALSRLPAVQLKALAADYLAISDKANDQLDHEVDAYGDDEHDNLAAARADLRAEITTERWWDSHLLLIPFPPALETIARAVVQVNRRRIALTERQARASTLPAMVALDARHKAADSKLEFAVNVIRRQLGLPPSGTS